MRGAQKAGIILSGGAALQFFISQVFSANFHEFPLPSRHFPPANGKITVGFQNFISFFTSYPSGGLVEVLGRAGRNRFKAAKRAELLGKRMYPNL